MLIKRLKEIINSFYFYFSKTTLDLGMMREDL
jgi:hypothetical protein